MIVGAPEIFNRIYEWNCLEILGYSSCAIMCNYINLVQLKINKTNTDQDYIWDWEIQSKIK